MLNESWGTKSGEVASLSKIDGVRRWTDELGSVKIDESGVPNLRFVKSRASEHCTNFVLHAQRVRAFKFPSTFFLSTVVYRY